MSEGAGDVKTEGELVFFVVALDCMVLHGGGGRGEGEGEREEGGGGCGGPENGPARHGHPPLQKAAKASAATRRPERGVDQSATTAAGKGSQEIRRGADCPRFRPGMGDFGRIGARNSSACPLSGGSEIIWLTQAR